MTLKDHLLTNVERVRKGIGRNNSCGFCAHGFEDVLHVIRDYTVIPEDNRKWFFSGDLSKWFAVN